MFELMFMRHCTNGCIINGHPVCDVVFSCKANKPMKESNPKPRHLFKRYVFWFLKSVFFLLWECVCVGGGGGGCSKLNTYLIISEHRSTAA